jgi:predicted esterase
MCKKQVCSFSNAAKYRGAMIFRTLIRPPKRHVRIVHIHQKPKPQVPLVQERHKEQTLNAKGKNEMLTSAMNTNRPQEVL